MIAENHSFTRTGSAGGYISTSALSQNMRQLEDELGVKLLNRTAACRFDRSRTCLSCQYRYALNHIDEAMEHARQSRDIPGGDITP